MTKATTPPAPAVTTTIAPELKPQSLRLIGPVLQVLEQMAAHIRSGYVPDIELPVDLFGGSGALGLYLKLGDPQAQFIEAAKVATQEALVRQQAERQREIEDAAAQLVADRERAAARAVMEVQIAEQEATLKAMRAAAAAV